MTEKINNLKNYQILEIYILIVLFFSTLYLYKNDLIFFFYNNNVKIDTKTSSANFSKTQNKKSNLFISTFLNNLSKQHMMQVLSLIPSNNSISLKVAGIKQNGFNFLKDTTHHLIPLSFKIKNSLNKTNQVDIDIVYSTKKFYNEKNIYKENKQNPKANKKSVIQPKEEVKTIIESKFKPKSKAKPLIKLNAIINNYAFINNNWYQTGDHVDEYKLTLISKDFIYLKNKKTSQKVKIYLFDKKSYKENNHGTNVKY